MLAALAAFWHNVGMAGGLIHARGPVCAALVLLSAGLLPCFCEEDGLPSGADVVVAPLMETRWHQRRPFNDFMPVDWPDMPAYGNAVRNESKRGRMPCGCVADAMGQILRYYEWPVRLDETVSFEHNWKNERTPGSTVTGKVLQQFDGHVPFEFGTMTNAWIAAFKDPRGVVPEINRYSVARLTFAAGVLLEMDYGTNDSSSNPYTMISKLGTWYETPEYKNCRGSFAGGRAEILAALKAGMPVAASLPGHEIVIHGYATAGGNEYVFVANDGYGSDEWELADKLEINEAIVGFVPKKTVQLDPLRKVEDPTVEIRWALPRVWADAVEGFTARAVASGEAVRMVSVGKDARSCAFAGLTAGKKYSFSVTPDVAGAVASPPVEATIAGADSPAPPWPEIQDVWSTTTNGFGETWYHENAMGRGVVYVRCSKTVRSLEAVSGNLTALPQEKVGVRSFGGGLYAVELDGSNVEAMPSSAGTSDMNRLRVIVTLAASDENGTAVYRNLMVRFSDETTEEDAQTFEDGEIDDIRVDALVKSHWDQLYAGGNILFGEKCYNYYTPDEKHCGCVATALAQVMRYHEWPKEPVEPQTYACGVYLGKNAAGANDMGLVKTNLTMIGGTYDWSKMPFDTKRTDNDPEEMEMIGRLCYDVGVAMSSSYQNGMTAAAGYSAIHTFPKIFRYASAEAVYWTLSDNMTEYSLVELQKMVVPSLDAGLPCVLTIYGDVGGHSVVCDGYGFDKGAFMLHVNGGYSGIGDGWHSPTNFKNICGRDYTSLNGVTFNISPTNTGSIASGRVLDIGGRPIAGAKVTVRRDGAVRKTMATNAKGIYFFWGEPGTYDVTAENGVASASIRATLGKNVSVDVRQDGSYTFPLASVAIGNSPWNDLTLDAGAETVAKPVASAADRTRFRGSLAVTLTCATAGATIRYTTDGTAPTAQSPVYAEPILLTESATVCAVAFKAGMLASAIAEYTYLETTLGDALECPDLPWRAGGDGAWTVESSGSYDGADSLRSPQYPVGQPKDSRAYVEATVKGPATLSFWYKYDPFYYAPFQVVMDATTNLFKISKSYVYSPQWTFEKVEIPAGVHTVRFEYWYEWLYKQYEGFDGVWLDQVTYTYAGEEEDGGSEPTIADGEFVGTLAKNDAGEYVVTLADGVFGVSLENVGTNTIVVPPRTQFVVGVPVGQIRVRSGDYDVSDAFGLYGDAADGCFLSLEEGRSVTLGGETIPVVPILAAITGDGLVPKKPFVVTETAVAFGVKAIPGLTYTLLRSDDLSTVRSGTAVDTQLAEGLRVRLQDEKGTDNRVFYVIRVNVDN